MKLPHIAACGLSLALAAAAQMPRFTHAQVTTPAAGPSLAAQLAQAEKSPTPLWLGYDQPRLAEDGGECGAQYLEPAARSGEAEPGGGTVHLEPSQRFAILYRMENGQIERVRMFSGDCAVDAGGLPVVWLSAVAPSQSVAALTDLARANPTNHSLANGAVAAIAMTRDAAAEPALENLAAPQEPERLREQVVFWLGEARGHPGFEALQRLGRPSAGEAASDALRTRVTFALNVSHDPGAVDELIRMAKTDAAPKVREQALFWLAQKAGAKAAGALGAAASDDPAEAVKQRAVFGLSQLPKDQGVPLLIHVAETNQDPAVRKRAMFWLGQSRDPRALAYFAQVLSRP